MTPEAPAPAVGALLRRWVPVLSIVAFATLSVLQAGEPLHLDNMDFPAAAKATAQTGQPRYYRGEELPTLCSLYHPPLYIYLLAGWFRVFGAGAVQARLFGALCAILFCWQTIWISRSLLGAPSKGVDWALWPVFLLQAYTLQSAAILDIDTSVYGPLLLGLAGAAAWVGRRRDRATVGGWEVALLAALLALTLWAKLTTVWLVVAALPLLLWPRLRRWRAFAVSAAVSLFGVGLFLATYFAYCRLVQVSPLYTFGFLAQSFLRGGGAPHYGANLHAMVPFVAWWTGLLPWGAALLVFTPWFGRRFAVAAAPLLQLRTLVGVALVGSGYYMAQTMTFGRAPFKYVFVFWPLVVLPLGLLCGAAVAARAQPGRWPGAWRAAVFVLAALAGALLWGWLVTGDTHLLGRATRGALLGAVLPAALGALAALWWLRGRRERTAAAAWLLATAMQVGYQTGVAAYQVGADHSTSYDYGQQGLSETIAYVRAHTTPDQVISSMKDVGFQAERRYFENYQALYGGHEVAARLIRAWESGRVALIVFTEGIGSDQAFLKPELGEWLGEHADLVASFGNYRIYRPRPIGVTRSLPSG